MSSQNKKNTALATVATVAAVAVTVKIVRPAIVSLSSRLYVQYLAKSKSSSEPEGSVSGLFIHPGEACCCSSVRNLLLLPSPQLVVSICFVCRGANIGHAFLFANLFKQQSNPSGPFRCSKPI
jgi:hypothetical protein